MVSIFWEADKLYTFLRTVAKWSLEKAGPVTFKQHFAKLQKFNARVPTPFPPILCEATLLREKAGRHMLIPEPCAWLQICFYHIA